MKASHHDQPLGGEGKQLSACTLFLFLGVFILALGLFLPTRVQAQSVTCVCGSCGTATIPAELQHLLTCEAACDAAFPACTGGGTTVEGCGPLNIVKKPCVTVSAFDPDTGVSLVTDPDATVQAQSRLRTLTDQAIGDVLQIHGLPDGLPATERTNVTTWARDSVRARMFARLVNIINTPEANRTADEKVLYKWLTNLVWQKRIDSAQEAWNQYRAWERAGDQFKSPFPTCNWHPPNDKGYMVLENNVLTLKDDCKKNGGPCFAGFAPVGYDHCQLVACGLRAGTGIDCAFTFVPSFPPYKDFKSYGGALANKEYAEDPNAIPVLSNTAKAIAITVGVGAVLALGFIAVVIANTGIAATIGAAVFPFAWAVSSGVAAGIGIVLGSLLVAVLAVVILIVGGVQLGEYLQIAPCLKADIRKAAGRSGDCDISTQEGKPNLTTLVTTEKGNQEILLAFTAATLPEQTNTAPAPVPGNDPLWAVMDQNRIPLPGESGQILSFATWDNSTMKAGLLGGWFVSQIPLSGGTTLNSLELGIEYLTPTGEKFTAWRSKCPAGETVCIPGQEIFIHTRNGDDPPSGQTTVAFKAWFAKANKEISYKTVAGASRIARLNHLPTATGFMAGGPLEEGQEITLSATGSDPDGDTVSFVWDFKDGSDTIFGSVVQHAFPDNGTFNVQITAKDVFGAQGAPKTFPLAITNVPPAITLARLNTGQILEGQSATLEVSFTDPGTADSHKIDADWGDGQVDTVQKAAGSPHNANLSHQYLDNPSSGDSYSVSTTVTDKDNGSDSRTTSIIVQNVAPTATFSAASGVNEGSVLGMSLSDPFDPSPIDRATLQYAFSCGNGFSNFISQSQVACLTSDSGDFTVGGRIKDKDNGVSEYTKIVHINNVPPTVHLPQLSGTLNEGSIVEASVGFRDPGANDAPFSCTFDFGDNSGTQPGEFPQPPGPVLGGSGGTCKKSHSYADNGDYQVAATVTDKDAGSGANAAVFTINNVAPTATFTATAEIFQGESSTLMFSDPFDPSPMDTEVGFVYSFDCTNDGTFEATDEMIPSFSCSYATSGTFTAGGTIKDKDGGVTLVTAIITVLSPQGAAATVRDEVQLLADQKVLNNGQANALTTKLNDAITQLDKGKLKVATNMLQAFINQVTDLIKDGVMPPAEGQTLIDLANRVIVSITFI